MICPQFRPLTGGYERAAERLSMALAARGNSVTVITERRDRAWRRREELDGVYIRRLWCIYRRRLHLATALYSFAFWLLRHGRSFDVWHVHQYGVHAALAVFLGKVCRRPVVLKLTNSADQGISKTIEEGRMALLQGWAHRQVAACIAVSEESRLDAIKFGIPELRIYSIPNGVDTQALRPATPAETGAARRRLKLGDGVIAVAVGRLAVEKNPLGLLEAWRKAKAELPASAHLVWIGDGPLRDEMAARVFALGLEGSVLLAGHSDAVRVWLAAADMFLLPSRNEGMANTLLEAMACGLPSAAAAVSGVPQLLGVSGAGLVVPIGDMDAFAGAIVRLAGDPRMRHQMGTRARQVIETGYSLDTVTDRTLMVYERILQTV